MITENKTVDTVILILFLSFWFSALVNKTERSHFNLPNVFNKSKGLGKCYLEEHELNIVDINLNYVPSFDEIRKNNSHLSPGGLHSPRDCKPFQKVAILIPYRNREDHLKILLNRLHSMLLIQKIHYKIFVIEQEDANDFNRGMLMNVGAIEALKDDPEFDCFIFHDVDLIPEHNRNIYMCNEDSLRNFAAAINENRYHYTFINYAGGVSGLSKRSFFRINGFPNLYWGWGNEDDDFSARTLNLNMNISRPPLDFARYKMIRHVKATRIVFNAEFFFTFRGRHMSDGINSLTKDSYTVKDKFPAQNVPEKDEEFLFTRIKVALNAKQSALPFSPIAVLTEEEESYLTSKTKKLESVQWPLPTTQSVWWYLRFYSWI